MCQICIKIFKSENCVSLENPGGLAILFPTEGGWVLKERAGNVLLYRGAEPLGGLENLVLIPPIEV